MHEILFATLTYQLICVVLAPWLSTWLFPRIYPALPRRTRLNWDVHVVSMTQSIAINALALWVMAVDEERGSMGWEQRVWGYDGAGGMIQGFAAGYFLWDLLVCLRWVDVFGWGMLAHAVAALVVFSLGFVSNAPVFTSGLGSKQISSSYYPFHLYLFAVCFLTFSDTDNSAPLSISTAQPSFSTSSHPPSSTSTGSSTKCT